MPIEVQHEQFGIIEYIIENKTIFVSPVHKIKTNLKLKVG